MLAGEHPAGASDAALHLIEHQQDPVAIAERAQALKETVGGHEVPTLALDRLDHDRGHFGRGHVALEQDVLDIVERRTPLIGAGKERPIDVRVGHVRDRKSTRLNSSHVAISYAVFCLKKKKNS